MVHPIGLAQQESSQTHFSRVLIVEDDLAQLRTLIKIMEAEGFAVVGCQLAGEGLAQIRHSFFGVIIIDLSLPDLHGITLVEQIRQLTDQAHIIVYTGYGSFTSAKALLNLGVFALVEKLSDPQELVNHVHRAVHDQISQYAKKLEQTVAERSTQLREIERWLELAQNAAGVGLWHWDLLTQIARCSDVCMALFGVQTNPQMVTLQEWLHTLHPEDYKRALIEINQVITTGASYNSEYRVIWPDGTIHWLAHSGQVIFDETGRAVHMIGATFDVTQRNEAQAALKSAYNELELRVQERTAELQQTNLRLLQEVEERRKTEEALRLANFSLDHAADAIFLAGPAASLVYVNEAVCRLHGYTRAELLHMQVHEFNPALGEWLIMHRDHKEAGPITWEQEGYHHTRDGRIFPVELTINRLQFHGAAYWCVIVRDITARRAAETQRQQQTLALMSLWKSDIFQQGKFIEAVHTITAVAAHTLQVARVGIWLFSPDRSKIECIDLYQLAVAQHVADGELRATDYPHYFQALEADRIIVAHNAQIDPQTYEFADNYLAPQGITAMLDAPIRIDEGLVGILCHEHIGSPRVWTVEEQNFASELADILAIALQTNKRFQIEQKLQESEEMRDLAVQGAGIALWDWHVPTGRLQVDERWAAIREYQLDEIHDHIDFEMNMIHPDDRAEVKQKLNRHLEAQTPFYEIEYRTQTKSGQWKWIHSRGKVVGWSETGLPIRFLGTQMDITDYKQLEQQLLHAQKMEAIGRLAGGVAHDFNNMLTVIISYSELILGRSTLEPRVRARVEEIRKAGERAALLTQQLLAFSRKQVMTTTLLDLNLVVAEMDQMLQRLIGEDVKLQLKLAPEACWIKADSVQMEQVVMNLVINARDAMPTGGEILIQTCQTGLPANIPQFDYLQPDAEYILLAVVDTGSGMDVETQARIFEPFFTTKESGKGTGLGLSMVFGIIRQHNGYIDVQSTLGQGTTFHIYLPLAETAEYLPPLLTPFVDAAVTGEETILLVEDEEQIRALACITLQEAGYTVLVAANGQDALSLARQNTGPLHLLVTDVVLPGINGVQLTEQIHTLHPESKTLYISGYADSELAASLIEPTANTIYLSKPFTPNGLMQKVRIILDS